MPGMPRRPRVAFIGTGGTIASLGDTPLDLLDYGQTHPSLAADAIVARTPELAEVAEVVPVAYRAVPSSRIGFEDWKALAALCARLEAEDPSLAGIVIGHGTGTMEETAYFLSLTLKVRIPVVMTGSQRPASALSGDGPLNLINAVRTAASPDARGLGVLVLLNDEIHAAREVTKTSTLRMQTFRTPDFGALGHADGDRVVFYRRPLRRAFPDTEFDLGAIDVLPRVDIAYGYAGSDGTAIRAFTAAGARGIVYAGFAPGMSTPDDFAAMEEAVAAGVVVMQCTRVGSDRVVQGRRLRAAGILTTDNLTPQKARLLLALALTGSGGADEIARVFATY
jgi:L-asparaginase